MKARIYGRFSSKPQERGDSRRRQIEGAVEYAKKNNIELVKGPDGQPVVYFDEGVSGKEGLNLEREFGRLLKEAKPGETILCEEADRIGRQNPIDVLSIIKEKVIKIGLSIIFHRKNLIVDAISINNPAVLFSLFGETTVSFSDNSRKIDRQRKRWGEKRLNGANAPLTATCPSWIKPIVSLDERGNKVRKGFELIPESAAIVKRIFDLSFKGYGNTAMCKLFNQTGVKPIGDSDGWHQSVIDRILKNRAVLGEFQPHVYQAERKRVPIGEPIPNYYPKIKGIDEKYFNAVQYKRKLRKIKGSGRRGDVVGNLFTSICKCGFCGAPMVYSQKQTNTLVCDKARRGKDCRYCGYDYREFETSFLNYVSELDLASVLNPETNPNSRLVIEIEKCRATIGGIETQLQNLANAIALGKGKMEILVSKMESLESDLTIHQQKLDELITEQAMSSANVVKVGELKQLIAKAQDKTASDANETRLALREAIRNIVNRIDTFPYEIIPIKASEFDWKQKRELTKAGYSLDEDLQRVERCYRIHFKNEDNYRVIYSHPRYPLSRNLKYIVEKAA